MFISWIFTYNWAILGINGSKYSIHGAFVYGLYPHWLGAAHVRLARTVISPAEVQEIRRQLQQNVTREGEGESGEMATEQPRNA
jgi:hypothetical protein